MDNKLRVVQEHLDTLTTRYVYLKKSIATAGGTKLQRKEAEALKWVIKKLTKEICDFRYGDYSPAMDEIFDAKEATKED